MRAHGFKAFGGVDCRDGGKAMITGSFHAKLNQNVKELFQNLKLREVEEIAILKTTYW